MSIRNTNVQVVLRNGNFVDEIPQVVKDDAALVALDGLNHMRGMAMDHIDTALNCNVSESAEPRTRRRPHVWPPMQREHDEPDPRFL